jgi:hypothetical protein
MQTNLVFVPLCITHSFTSNYTKKPQSQIAKTYVFYKLAMWDAIFKDFADFVGFLLLNFKIVWKKRQIFSFRVKKCGVSELKIPYFNFTSLKAFKLWKHP